MMSAKIESLFQAIWYELNQYYDDDEAINTIKKLLKQLQVEVYKE